MPIPLWCPLHVYIYIYLYIVSVEVGAWHQLGQKAHKADILTQALCSAFAPRHEVLVVLLLTAFVSGTVHCRSAIGHWKHQQRSINRGFARRPCVPTYLAYIGNSMVPTLAILVLICHHHRLFHLFCMVLG